MEGLQQHDLAHEFPEHIEQIKRMKQANRHFANLASEYETVNQEIQKIEKQGINVSDERFEALKLKRLKLKDEIYAMLTAA